ncbi:biotin/lipoyl-containing protein [Nannocystaceae bacterium ST9]
MAAESNPSGYRIRVGEREHRVEILAASEGQPLRVRVDGHEFEVANAGVHALRVAPQSGEDRRQLEVTLASDGGRASEAWLSGTRAKLAVQTEREARLAAALGKSSAGHGSGELLAPMPGRVVKVGIALGDRVERGAPIMIVEAMKMENELQAPISGIVRSIAVQAGAAVDANQVLCVIEPEPAA